MTELRRGGARWVRKEGSGVAGGEWGMDQMERGQCEGRSRGPSTSAERKGTTRPNMELLEQAANELEGFLAPAGPKTRKGPLGHPGCAPLEDMEKRRKPGRVGGIG